MKEEEDSVQKIKELQEQGKILYTELTDEPGRKSRKLWWRRPSLKWKKCAAKRYWRHSGTDDCFIRTEGCEKEREKVIQWVDDKLEVFIGAVFLALWLFLQHFR